MITSLDDLKFMGGYPTPETLDKLFDQLDLQRAAQAYLDFIPAMSMQAFLDMHPRDMGVSETGGMGVYVGPGAGHSCIDRLWSYCTGMKGTGICADHPRDLWVPLLTSKIINLII